MSLESLQAENEALKREIQRLKLSPHGQSWTGLHGMDKEQVERYSRHLLLGSFGLEAQEKLCRGSALIIGCGGLGSPVALYLAGCGVGRIGLVDHDTVETSNLHRQIIHSESRVGQSKASSASSSCLSLNSSIKTVVHDQGLNQHNALELLQGYDVIIDCSDNAPTRYLVSDACVVSGKPLVSAAAVGTDGQLTCYHYGPDGPCYRCLFPEAPAPENCSRCSDAGVLGIVPGVMGTLQALEAIKILSGKGDVLSRRMLIFDGLAARFTSVKLRAKSPLCVTCGETPSITSSTLSSYDYSLFTGQEVRASGPAPLKLIDPRERVMPGQAKAEMDESLSKGEDLMLLDVRPADQFNMAHLSGAINIPISELDRRIGEVVVGSEAVKSIYVICRRGNQSQRAVLKLREAFSGNGVNERLRVVDIVGGTTQWASDVDPTMPIV